MTKSLTRDVYVYSPDQAQADWFGPNTANVPDWVYDTLGEGHPAIQDSDTHHGVDDDLDLEYEEMTQPQLRQLLKDRGLPVSGSKGEQIARLEEDDAKEPEAEDEDQDITEEEVAKIHEEARELGIDPEGKTPREIMDLVKVELEK